MRRPPVAVILTMIAGGILFAAMGKNPFEVIRTIFWDPIFGEFAFYLRGQLLVKAGPLILIAIGLALGFRAGIWNIGAEGQYIMGAIFGAGVGLAVFPTESRWIFPVMVIAGAFGGWLWAMIPAILKTRFNTNEILVSLMLVYVAETILAKASTGFLKNPEGMGFPGSRNFSSYPAAQNGFIYEPLGLHWGGVAALVTAVLAYVLLTRHQAGFQIKLAGQAPRAARFHGVNPDAAGGDVHGNLGRAGRAGGDVRGDGPGGADQHRLQHRLRLYRDHRGLPRAAEPLGDRAGRVPDGADLRGGRDGVDQPRPAGCGDPGVSGDAAVLPSGGGCADELPVPAAVRQCKRGGEVMDFGGINPVILIATLMASAVPILLAALGETVVERAGVLNLGVEGMMVIGALGGFIVAVETGSPVLGFIGGAVGGGGAEPDLCASDAGVPGQPGGDRPCADALWSRGLQPWRAGL